MDEDKNPSGRYVTFRIPTEWSQKLDTLSEEREQNISQLIRYALKIFYKLEKEEDQ
jgi:predicted transcriptional regulator